MADVSAELVNNVYNKLKQDPDMQDLFANFKAKFYEVGILSNAILCSFTYQHIYVNNLRDTTIFLLRFLSYGQRELPESFAISQIKFFYLMLNAADLIKDKLVNSGLLTYKGSPLIFNGGDSTFIQLAVFKASQSLSLVFNMHSNKDDKINLHISGLFGSELDYNYSVSLYVYNVLENKTASVALPVDKLTKSFLIDLINQV